ncbi:MAG: hypothetical protein JWO13_2543 [Acidobacteriales bacterium]|nr:hypothetical protein [Terriglobales bacterium]
MRILLAFLAFASVSASAQVPIGEVRSSDASVRGAVVLSNNGASIMSGSQITAGERNASLKLARGGDINVCSGSSINVTSSNSGHEHLIALNNGALETHYTIASSADTIMTPDFRLLLAGPGAFHFGVSMSQRGDMCVQSLAGNTSSIIVNEQLGDGTHQVRPGESVMFHNGRVADATINPGVNCGCPAQPPPKPAVATRFGFPEQQSRAAAQAIASGETVPVPVIPLPANPPSQPGQVYMQVDAPVVFRGEDAPALAPSSLLLARAQLPAWPPEAAQAFAVKPPPKKKWYQRFGSALATVFGTSSKN